MRSLTINADSDGVIYDWHGFMIPYLSGGLNVELTRESFQQWDMAAALGISKKEFYEIFDRAVEDGCFLRGYSIPGAIDALTTLVNAGHRVRIVTNKLLKGSPKTARAEIDFLNWFRQFGLLDKVEIVFTGNRFGKTDYHADLVIDDKSDLSWVQPYPAVNVLFDQPWNQDGLGNLARIDEDPNYENPTIYRAVGWGQVLELAEQMGAGVLVDKSPVVV